MAHVQTVGAGPLIFMGCGRGLGTGLVCKVLAHMLVLTYQLLNIYTY